MTKAFTGNGLGPALTALLLTGALVATTASAHDFFLRPPAPPVPVGQTVEVQATVSSIFPGSDIAVTPARIRAVWTLQLGIGVVLAVLAGVASTPVSSFYGEPRMREIMWLLGLSYLVNPFGSLTYAWLMRTLRFEDTTRPTAANGSFPARPARALPQRCSQFSSVSVSWLPWINQVLEAMASSSSCNGRRASRSPNSTTADGLSSAAARYADSAAS